ncbi:MAG: M43 family zinc metalloprotease [Bacteroidota bacterium]
MKKQLFTLLGVTVLTFGSIAQNGLKLHPCATYEAMEEGFKADPGAKARYEASQAQFELEYAAEINRVNSAAKVAVPVYTIPVVFHVMGNLNVTDQAFLTLMTYVNNDYAKTGSDVGTINPSFSSLYVDSEIRFVLAKKDPNGNCTNGIIRHDADNSYWSQSNPAYNYSGTGTNRWPTNKYLNIYIVECISSASMPCPPVGSYIGGYTYLPGGVPMFPINLQANGNMGDAIVMLRNQVNVSGPSDARTISHEIGHWLNLAHTFGSSNNPKFDPSNMPTAPITCSTDNVADTPPTGGYFSICTPNALDCSIPNIENIMDYASCPKMFTQGQTTRMRTALTSSTAGRNNLWSPANLDATGITPGYTCTAFADFEANKVYNCAGNTFTFTSLAQVGTSGGISWNFQGGTPATSTATTQVVTYATPGTYSVSLTATNSISSNTMNKTSYINVINGVGGPTLPTSYDFQGATLPSSITVTNVNAGSPTWIQNNSIGASSTTKSIYINNASVSSTPGHVDIFETPVYNFSNTTSINFSFYYAYAKRAAAQADTFKVQYSLDCGGSWSNVIGSPNTSVMASASGGTTTAAFVPTTAQWILKSYVPTLLNALNNKPSVKFRFWFKGDASSGISRSNNIYIDQINLTGNVVTSITELERSMELTIYPNPTSSSSTLDFTITKDQSAKISVVDVMGRVLEQNAATSGNDGHVTYKINQNGHLASGVYIVNIDVNNQRISKKLIIQ